MIIVDNIGHLIIAVYMGLINVTTFNPNNMTIQDAIDVINWVEPKCSIFLQLNGAFDPTCTQYLIDAATALQNTHGKVSEEVKAATIPAIMAVKEYLNDVQRINANALSQQQQQQQQQTVNPFGGLANALNTVDQMVNEKFGIPQQQSELDTTTQKLVNFIDVWVYKCSQLELDPDTIQCSNQIFNSMMLLKMMGSEHPKVKAAIEKAIAYDNSPAASYYNYK